MTAEEFDTKISESADWFIQEMNRMNAQFESKLDAIILQAKANSVPDHLIKTSVQAVYNKIQAEAK